MVKKFVVYEFVVIGVCIVLLEYLYFIGNYCFVGLEGCWVDILIMMFIFGG